MFGIRAVLVWILVLFLLLMASLLVASEYSDRNITSLHDIWMPADLFNLTSSNSTGSTQMSSGLKSKVSDKSRVSKSKKKKGLLSSANSTNSSQSQSAPVAEALRSPIRSDRTSLNDNRRALYSVDSWMGNIAELPLPRVKELRTLAAASMRNHQKIHPSLRNTAASSNRASVSNGDHGEEAEDPNDYGRGDPNEGENYQQEHPTQTSDDGAGDFPHEEEIGGPQGNSHPPACAGFQKFYCDMSDEYPTALINQVTKYLKWPLEKLFRDLRGLQPPTLADSENGNLVCDSMTRIIRPGWARNTNGKWLVVINTPYHIQTVTEIKCRDEESACAYIAPCFHSSCQQRYNIQSLLVIDPNNHYKGPFLSQFLFPSSCVCFVPDPKLVLQAQCQASPKYGS